jgi:hypothetical protein
MAIADTDVTLDNLNGEPTDESRIGFEDVADVHPASSLQEVDECECEETWTEPQTESEAAAEEAHQTEEEQAQNVEAEEAKQGELQDNEDEDGAVHAAADQGNIAETQLLLASDITRLEAKGYLGRTPLDYAAWMNRPEMTQMLIQGRAHVDS